MGTGGVRKKGKGGMGLRRTQETGEDGWGGGGRRIMGEIKEWKIRKEKMINEIRKKKKMRGEGRMVMKKDRGKKMREEEMRK